MLRDALGTTSSALLPAARARYARSGEQAANHYRPFGRQESKFLSFKPQVKKLTWVGFASNATRTTVFHIDHFNLTTSQK